MTLKMESNDLDSLLKNICESIDKYNELLWLIFHENSHRKYNEYVKTEEYSEEKLNELKALKNIISPLLDNLYYLSDEQNYFYPDCTFKVFVKHFNIELEKIKKNTPDASSLDIARFFKKWHGNILYDKEHRYLNINESHYYYGDLIINSLKYRTTKKRKLKYLSIKIKELGFDVKTLKSSDLILTKRNKIISKQNNRKEQKYFDRFQKIEMKLLSEGYVPKKSIKNINSLLSNEFEQNQENKKVTFNNQIFTTEVAEAWFFDTLEKLNALDDKGKAKKRHFQPKANAIWSNQNARKHILKYDLSLKQYIEFLNTKFDAELKNKDKLSKPDNHANKVAELFETFKK